MKPPSRRQPFPMRRRGRSGATVRAAGAPRGAVRGGPPSAARYARGATLIEVLIAMLVLAVGILGLMGLQINGKRTNYEALQRSAAVSLAQDIMNRMRVNSSVTPTDTFLDTNYDTGGYTGDGVGGGQVATPPTDCAAAGAACTPADLADFDLAAWEAQLDDAVTSNGLVNPTGCIDVDTSAADGSLVTVTVAWESRIDLDQTALLARMPVDCGGTDKYGTGNTRRQAVVIATFLPNR